MLEARWRYLRACVCAMLGTGRTRVTAGRPQVVVVVSGFPPAVWGGVYRPTALCRHADLQRLDLSVIAGPSPAEVSRAGRYLLESLPPALEVHRANVDELARYKSFSGHLPRLDGGFERLVAHYTAAIENLVRPPDLVFASGPRFESFVCAYLLARRFRARLILEYRDEWTQCPFPFVTAGPFDRRWERRCLRAADHVIFTTESQRKHQLGTFPELVPERCSVIPNGWDPADLAASRQSSTRTEHEPEARRRLAFVGFLGDHTLPDAFLAQLGEILVRRPDIRQAIRLDFIGNKSPRAADMLREFACPDVLCLVDQLPKPEALASMLAADALLLMNPPDFARYIPGKLYDYLAMRRPLLVFGAGGEIQQLVESHRAGWVVAMNDSSALEAVLGNISRGVLQTPDTTDVWLAEHTREVLAKRTWAVMSRVLGPGVTA
ncbi:MAG: hypothetical protein RL434_1514 [Pseudomonadota bacterium]